MKKNTETKSETKYEENEKRGESSARGGIFPKEPADIAAYEADEREKKGETVQSNGEEEKENAKKEKNAVRALLESLDWRNASTYFLLGKIMLFVFMLVIESFILIPQIAYARREHAYAGLAVVCVSVLTLTAAEIVRIAALKKFRAKLWCYCLDGIAAFFLTAVTGSRYLSTLYMIILTDYYLSAEKMTASFLGCFVSLVVYIVTMWVSGLIRETSGSMWGVLAQSFNDLVILCVHFIAVTFGVRFYRQSVRLSETLRRLDESNKRLEKAYADLAEATAIEERQRIAKDIHDTAGHSITTVIMQTEAAKLVIDKNPAEAKNRIVAANLQAKHALEELRESVHFLSGAQENVTLKEALLAIVRESCDGTGIAIRFDVDDADVSPAVFRFLCNSLKEGISNGLRHGGATAFYFECKKRDGEIGFLLSDNGRGVAKNFKKGFGLTGMEERAKSLGGSVTFTGDEEGGFEIAIVVPAAETQDGTSDGKAAEKTDRRGKDTEADTERPADGR